MSMHDVPGSQNSQVHPLKVTREQPGAFSLDRQVSVMVPQVYQVLHGEKEFPKDTDQL